MIRSLILIAAILLVIDMQARMVLDDFLAEVIASCPEALMECPK